MEIYTKILSYIAIAALSAVWAYKWQDYKYQAIIATKDKQHLSEIAEANADAIKQERKYNDEAKQNAEKAEQLQIANEKTAATVADVVKYRGLFVSVSRKSVCNSSDAPSSPVDGTYDAKLSDELAEKLQSESKRADDAAIMATAGHDYAVLMQNFINEQTAPK
jgi:hypothetical protein